MTPEPVVLGIETSCDETSAAVLRGESELLGHRILTQDVHEVYGGVVPELASRAHLRVIDDVVDSALREAGVTLREVDAIGATAGPGLIGALLVGLTWAKAVAYATGKPLVAVHHMEAHLFAASIDDPAAHPPFVALLVSGGHTMLLQVPEWGRYELLGETRDDAAGEAFDKVARVLGLPFPGGPHIDRAAQDGVIDIDFPRGLTSGRDMERHRFDFSFSGLKTAVARWVEAREASGEPVPVADVAAAFQEAVVDVLTRKALLACTEHGVDHLVIGGGVAANSRLRALAQERCAEAGVTLRVPRPGLCTDNGAMVAALGAEMVSRGRVPGPLDLPADSSMPVTQVSAT